ncbi:MAG: GDSL-type esterase/lipase family protein, partial [Candidatus Eisenbacteria bacterium]|nr:GDSL-type esterase/lipase family protein [Candidatus Eisenbacteria bacterium]
MFIGLVLAAMLLARGDTLGTIMPTGDSITDGDGSTDGVGYRNDLASLLFQHGIEFSYVGDELGGGQNPDFPGHFRSGARIEEFYPPTFGNGWGTGAFDIGPALDQIHPDVLLIHLGTNNVPSADTPLGPYSIDGGATLFRSYAGYMAELISFVASRYDGYPAGTPLVVVSRIIPIINMVDRVEAFNGYLDEMARDMARGLVTGAPVHVVVCDQFTPFIENPLLFTGLPGDYMSDWGHPNDLGYSVMAGSYLATLRDDAPPGTVEDLAVWGQGPHSVRLWWTSPGDDWWSGTAAVVTMRFAPLP